MYCAAPACQPIINRSAIIVARIESLLTKYDETLADIAYCSTNMFETKMFDKISFVKMMVDKSFV